MADSTAEVFDPVKFARIADESGMNGRELAAELGVTPTTLSALRNGRRAPSLDLLHRIVQVLGGVAADYLDLPDRKRWNLRHFRLAAALTQLEVAEDLGVAPAAVSGWESRRYKPPASVRTRLAGLYGATSSELDDAVERDGVVTTADGMLVTAESVVGLAVAALGVAESLSDPRKRALVLIVRDHVERSLEALGGAVRELPDDRRRAAVVDVLRRLAEAHAAADAKST